MRRALSGVTVIELGRGIAPSYCGKLFADLGAEVMKVDPGGSRDDRGGLVLHLHTNKRSASLDPGHAADRAAVRDLVERADLVIESRGRGTLGDWGLEWEDLHRARPALSTVHLSGFGATGPYADYRWEDIVVQAVSGAFLLQNNPEQEPLKLPNHVGLYFIGHMAALGAMAALTGVERGGDGAFVDCSAVEILATFPMRQAFLLGYQYRDRQPPPADVAAATATLIPTGVFPCADGYVALMSTTQQLGEMLDVLGDPEAKAAFARPDAFNRPETKEILDVALYTWLLTRTRAQATEEAQKAGWPLTGVHSAEEVLEADHLHQRNYWVHFDDPELGPLDLPGPWCRFGEGGWGFRSPAPAPGRHTDQMRPPSPPAPRPAVAKPRQLSAAPPLEGVRVLDLTVVWAGPYATMLLADLGAEVIRVENPFVLPPTTKGYHPRPVLTNPGMLGSLYGSPRPGAPDRPWNRHAMNNSLARNKLSVTIDNRRPEGLELVMRLAEQCDVVVDNFKANGLERIGIDVSELHRRNPRLIVVRLPPAGLTGDWASYTGFGAQFDALSGLSAVCGHLGSDPTTTPATTYMDAASGPAGAMAVLAALRYRAATGRGQFVELSQSENVMSHLGEMFIDQQLGISPTRLGNRHDRHAPQGLYRCRDEGRWIALSCPDDASWRALAHLLEGEGPLETGGRLDRGAVAGDGRFDTAADRLRHHDALDELISAWTAGREMVDAFHELQRSGVPAGPLLDDEMFTDDPNLAARGWFRPLESADVGTHLHPGPAFTGVPLAWRRGAPVLGEDNEYVYRKLLGVSDDDYRRYQEERIMATDYLQPDGTPF